MANAQVRERLLVFINAIGLSVANFERTAGVSNGYVRNFRGSFGGNKLDKILSAFPQLNRYWLTTGQGDMLIKESMPQDESKEDVLTSQPDVAEPVEDYSAIENVETLRSALRTAQHRNAQLMEQNAQLIGVIQNLTKK